MANGIRTGGPRGFNKGHSSKWTFLSSTNTWRKPKLCGNNKKDEDNSPKTLNDKKAKESSLPYYLVIAGGKKTDRVELFLWTLAWSEAQTTVIWTLTADSFSYNDNRFTYRFFTFQRSFRRYSRWVFPQFCSKTTAHNNLVLFSRIYVIIFSRAIS